MYNSYPENEIGGERVMLIDLKDGGSIDFGHITVRFVRVAKASSVNPDTMRDEYNDGPNAAGYRFTSWSSNKKSAFFIEDLVIWSQMSKDRPDEKPYAVGLQYHDVHTVEKHPAKCMYETLEKLDKKLSKLDLEFGYGSGDLATYITRVASAMGIKRFITYKKDNRKYGNRDLSDKYSFDTWKATDIAWLVNNFVDEFHGRNPA